MTSLTTQARRLHPVIGGGAEDMHIQIGSNHYPTLRQLPEGWVLDIKPDRMPLIVSLLEFACALIVGLLVVSQLVPK